MATIFTGLMCLSTIFINTSGLEWDNYDEKILKRATYVCGNDKRYTETPCVKIFKKKELDVYHVTWGRR